MVSLIVDLLEGTTIDSAVLVDNFLPEGAFEDNDAWDDAFSDAEEDEEDENTETPVTAVNAKRATEATTRFFQMGFLVDTAVDESRALFGKSGSCTAIYPLTRGYFTL